MSEPLYLVRLTLFERRLYHFGKSRGLRCGADDLDYLVHALLAELCPGALRPYALMDWRRIRDPRRPTLCVLAYSPKSSQEILAEAQRLAEPDAYRCCLWEGAEAPADTPRCIDWPVGLRLGIRVRVCPTRRTGPTQEVDAFAHKCRKVGPGVPVDREAVYRDWLAERLLAGGARLLSAQMVQIQKRALYRRTQGADRRIRRAHLFDVSFTGTIEVVDGVAFAALLRRGIGRHIAFGFGMLVLRRTGQDRKERRAC